MRDMKATVINKSKWILEWAIEGGGWITVLSRSQDGTDISRENFRDALR